MKRSCFGVLRPTQKKSGFAAATCAVSAACSESFSGRNGGSQVPATCRPGNFPVSTVRNRSAVPFAPP